MGMDFQQAGQDQQTLIGEIQQQHQAQMDAEAGPAPDGKGKAKGKGFVPSGGMCRFFQRGQCTKGADCAFSHGEEFIPTGDTGVPASNPDDDLAAFVQKWGLDSKSEEMLRTLRLSYQQYIITNFDPKGETRNMDAKLMGLWASQGEGLVST